jgi:hypothetical protein
MPMMMAPIIAAAITMAMTPDGKPSRFDSQHCLNFLPLPHGQRSFRPGRGMGEFYFGRR